MYLDTVCLLILKRNRADFSITCARAVRRHPPPRWVKFGRKLKLATEETNSALVSRLNEKRYKIILRYSRVSDLIPDGERPLGGQYLIEGLREAPRIGGIIIR